MSGSNKLYYLADKGLKPSGVFVRRSNVSASATRKVVDVLFDISSARSKQILL